MDEGERKDPDGEKKKRKKKREEGVNNEDGQQRKEKEKSEKWCGRLGERKKKVVDNMLGFRN